MKSPLKNFHAHSISVGDILVHHFHPFHDGCPNEKCHWDTYVGLVLRVDPKNILVQFSFNGKIENHLFNNTGQFLDNSENRWELFK